MKPGELTNEDMRLTVAAVHGWNIFNAYLRPPGSGGMVAMSDYLRMKGLPMARPLTDWENKGELLTFLPDYPNDLNACHEFEKSLSHGEWLRYTNALDDLPRDPSLSMKHVIHATARQRCEALLAIRSASES